MQYPIGLRFLKTCRPEDLKEVIVHAGKTNRERQFVMYQRCKTQSHRVSELNCISEVLLQDQVYRGFDPIYYFCHLQIGGGS